MSRRRRSDTKPRRKAPQGSPNKFGWLAKANVTFRQKATESRYEIPLRLVARAFSSLLAQKKFDFAQDDMMIDCVILCIRYRKLLLLIFAFCQFDKFIVNIISGIFMFKNILKRFIVCETKG